MPLSINANNSFTLKTYLACLQKLQFNKVFKALTSLSWLLRPPLKKCSFFFMACKMTF